MAEEGGTQASLGLGKTYLTEEAAFLLPPLLCNKSKSYLRICFTETEDECGVELSKDVRSCLKKYDSKIPQTFSGKDEITKWGTIVGACARKTRRCDLLRRKNERIARVRSV